MPQDGHRAIVATMGITLDGVMRNKIGEEAEGRIRKLVVVAAHEFNLILGPKITEEFLTKEALPKRYQLKNGIEMFFGSEPDISFFTAKDDGGRTLLCTVEIKGGTDPAGALERYGAAQKSFQSALGENRRCQNYFLSAVFTEELRRRIATDPIVHKFYNIINLLEDKDERKSFIREIFHFTLRLL